MGHKAAPIHSDAMASKDLELSMPSSGWLLVGGDCLKRHHNLMISGATGVGKTFLACALADKACRGGFAARYFRLPRLVFELALARVDGSYLRLLTQLAKTVLFILDDWGIAPLEGQTQHDLPEVIETGRRVARRLSQARCRQVNGTGSSPIPPWQTPCLTDCFTTPSAST